VLEKMCKVIGGPG